tara:strand:+ start:853 stop:1326 length:474 start_codon:yes stop_codon:yes gene_type:complete
MPSSSSFLKVSGAQPFSYFLNGGAAKKSKKSKKTRSVIRKKTRKKTKQKRVKSRMKTNKKKRISKRKSLRKSNRSRTLTLPSMSSEKTLRCKCDKNKKIKGTEPSPKGLGYCAHCTPLNVIMKGKDGKLWENKKYSKGKRWVKVKSQNGGFIRSGTY